MYLLLHIHSATMSTLVLQAKNKKIIIKKQVKTDYFLTAKETWAANFHCCNK